MLRRYLSPEMGFFFFAWLATVVVFRSRGLADPGTLWHIRVGERIFASGIMRTDPFTFTFAGKTWIPQQWGGECLMALAHGIGGLDTILLGFSLMIAMLFTAIFRWLRVGGMGWPLAAAVATFAMVAAGFHFYARPHLITIAFMAVVARFLVNFDRASIGLRHLIWLFPLHIVWTNIHGGMLGGVFTLALAAFGWSLQYLMKKDSPLTSWRMIAGFAGIIGLTAATMFVNPIGLELQRTWFRIVGSEAMAKYVSEHSPLSLAREGDRAVVCFAVFYAAILLTASRREWRVTWFLPIVWFLLTLKGIRQGPLFVVVAVVGLADIWPHTRLYAWLRKTGDLLANDAPSPLTWRALLIPVFVVVGAVKLQANRVVVPVVGSGWATLSSPAMPVDLIAPLQELASGLPDRMPIYNDINFGGFLIYFTPSLAIFGDDRFELCGDEWLANYVETIANHPERFDEWQRQYGFRHALIANHEDSPLENHLRGSGRWMEVARGKTAVLYSLRPE